MIKMVMMKVFGMRKGMLDCHAVAEILQEYLDDELDETRRDKIASHLDDCKRCGLEADTYDRIKQSLASQRATVPDDAVARLQEFGRELMGGGAASAT